MGNQGEHQKNVAENLSAFFWCSLFYFQALRRPSYDALRPFSVKRSWVEREAGERVGAFALTRFTSDGSADRIYEVLKDFGSFCE